MAPAPEWLSGVRIRRLGEVLRNIPSSPGGLKDDAAVRELWRVAGGPRPEIPLLLELLRAFELIRAQDSTVRRTKAGDQVARAWTKGDARPMGMVLIQAGHFHEQARRMIECGAFQEDGALVCNQSVREVAPQLVAVLSWWPEVLRRPKFIVPKALVQELNTVWALMPPPVEVPTWAVERKEIGNRAEMYTVQYERSIAASPSQVVWVARDSDAFGYDVEVKAEAGIRCIEVKGSRDREPVFYLSENEWRVASDPGLTHEVQFWGGIDLTRKPGVEYAALRAEGFPLVVRELVKNVGDGGWSTIPVRWRVGRLRTPVEPADR